jgi:hypothetical protein
LPDGDCVLLEKTQWHHRSADGTRRVYVVNQGDILCVILDPPEVCQRTEVLLNTLLRSRLEQPSAPVTWNALGVNLASETEQNPSCCQDGTGPHHESGPYNVKVRLIRVRLKSRRAGFEITDRTDGVFQSCDQFIAEHDRLLVRVRRRYRSLTWRRCRNRSTESYNGRSIYTCNPWCGHETGPAPPDRNHPVPLAAPRAQAAFRC